MPAASYEMAKKYAAIIRQILGGSLKKVILFGSRARGDAWEGSDYDIVIVVDQRTPKVREAVLEAGVRMMNEYDTLFAALTYNEKEWQQLQAFPLAWNIQKEGVTV